MSDKPVDLVQRLINAEQINPALRLSYQAELDAMLEQPLTARKAAPGVFLLVILVIGVVAVICNLLTVTAEPFVRAGWLVLLVGFSGAAYLIGRDLWLRKHSKKSLFAVTHLITGAAGMLTVVALMRGMGAAADPASTFHVLFALVFYIACLFWNLDSRISASELAAREQMLRVEFRLADLADGLVK